jgi:hypothetical protein
VVIEGSDACTDAAFPAISASAIATARNARTNGLL